jgi:hypothetical protein
MAGSLSLLNAASHRDDADLGSKAFALRRSIERDQDGLASVQTA